MQKIGHEVRKNKNGRDHDQSKPLNILARPARFERTTPAFGGQYSIQLSYGRKMSADSTP